MEDAKEIVISELVRADLVYRHYRVSFPYHAAAVERIRMVASAHWDNGTQAWLVQARFANGLREGLTEIHAILKRHGVNTDVKPIPSVRKLISAEAERSVGAVLETTEGYVTIDRLGKIFTGTRALARSSGLKIADKPVQYAWQRPSTAEEIERHLELTGVLSQNASEMVPG